MRYKKGEIKKRKKRKDESGKAGRGLSSPGRSLLEGVDAEPGLHAEDASLKFALPFGILLSQLPEKAEKNPDGQKPVISGGLTGHPYGPPAVVGHRIVEGHAVMGGNLLDQGEAIESELVEIRADDV